MTDSNEEITLTGTWICKIDNMPDLIEIFHDDFTFETRISGTDLTFKGKFRIDTGEKPWHIDLMVEQSSFQNMPLGKYTGIFEINGTTCRSCVAMPGQQRPQEFGEGSTLAERC